MRQVYVYLMLFIRSSLIGLVMYWLMTRKKNGKKICGFFLVSDDKCSLKKLWRNMLNVIYFVANTHVFWLSLLFWPSLALYWRKKTFPNKIGISNHPSRLSDYHDKWWRIRNEQLNFLVHIKVINQFTETCSNTK